MAPPSIGSPSSFPAGAVAPHRQPQQARRVVMAAARRRYKGTVRREAALADLVERKVAEATATCSGARGPQDEQACRVAWDQVEEVSRARAHLRRRVAEAPGDPLEHFCARNPTDDDCAVVYE